MTKIMCQAHKCLYNNNQKCVKEQISVEGVSAKKIDETFCDSFNKREREYDTEFASLDNKNSDIWCDACECMHHNSGKCSKDEISIVGSNANTSCETSCSSFRCNN